MTQKQTQTGLLTYEDYCLLPDDGKRYEIIEGTLEVSPAPIIRHQLVLSELNAQLLAYVKANRLGYVLFAPCDVLFDDHSIVLPDLIFVSHERENIITEKNIQGVPDLLVEIPSPSKPKQDTQTKRRLYAQFEVPHYWIVNPLDPDDKHILELGNPREGAYTLEKKISEHETFTPTLFPGLEIKVGELFSASIG